MPLRKNLKQTSPLYSRRVTRKKKSFKGLVLLLFVLVITAVASKVIFFDNNPKEKENVVAKTVNEVLKKEPPKPKDPAATVAEIETYLATQDGEYGYDIIELDTGREFGTRGENVYTAASTVKVALAAYVYNGIEKGTINPDKYLTYTRADYEGGTGSLQGTKIGSKYKVSYLLDRMIRVSDNVATNILMRTYGRSRIQAYLNANGLTEINLIQNQVTPRVMSLLLQKIYAGELINEVNRTELFTFMRQSIVPSRLVAGVPASVDVAHKIGTQSGAISDIGIVFLGERPYAISVYSKQIQNVIAAEGTIKTISQKVYGFETTR